ncbi:MAG: hypothetical protein J7M29_13035, partial [Verrucomicrobia bacterium]|nr:hypothetical protein [Verrucomicrobiota bacterium]
MFRELAANLTLIVLAGLGYGALLRLRRLGPRARRVAEGGFFALVGLAGMQFPVVLEKGLIFDGRSVALSVAGLFCGWEGAAAAAIPVALARLFMDGPGAV